MSMTTPGTAERFTSLCGRAVQLLGENIDTDQIIPAAYLKTTERTGLGKGLFAAWRQDPDFILEQPASAGATMLIAGRNFGCGSSREHAVWALRDYGFRVVISRAFADIFTANAAKNGLVTVCLDGEDFARLLAAMDEEPEALLEVDLVRQTLALPNHTSVSFPYDAFARECLIEGVDPLGYLLRQEPAIAEWESRQTQRTDTRAVREMTP